ncbi:MAG: hypothetical protein H6625_09875 [Bdellovibrionaceae bacterium]|nr:hypothetical protein [Pseudobdellovibrionaceae bacterium]
MRVFMGLIMLLFCSGAFAYPTSEVQWGGESDLDACGASGYTMAETVLITEDSNGLTSFKTIIPAGTLVTVCDDDSGYYGVLINEEGIDCGGGSAIVPVRKTYDGPCKSGWIKKVFLQLVAG